MTDNKNFKNIVREIADINGLTYTQAKEAAIELKKVLEEATKDKDSAISQYLESENVNNKSIFPFDYLLHKTSKEKCLAYQGPYSHSYSTIDRIQLSSERTPHYMDFGPLNRKINQAQYSNVLNVKMLSVKEEDVRLSYFTLLEDFGPDKSYFVDSSNYFTQMPKLIKVLEEYDGEEDLLVAILAPTDTDAVSAYEAESLSDNQIKTLRKLFSKVTDLIEHKNFCLISNYIPPSEPEVSHHIIKSSDSRNRIKEKLLWNNHQISYYPFEKTHGGSHYKTTKDTVIGYIQGKPHFEKTRMVFIETDENSCIEGIYDNNNKNHTLISWNNSEEMLSSRYFSKGKREDYSEIVMIPKHTYIKISFEMSDEELSKFCRLVYHSFDLYSPYRDIFSIIESPDSELIKAKIEEKFGFNKDEPLCSKYSLIDNHLYHEDFGEISLYKN